MGERLLCKQEVIGSIPFTSTTLREAQSGESGRPSDVCIARAASGASLLAPGAARCRKRLQQAMIMEVRDKAGYPVFLIFDR